MAVQEQTPLREYTANGVTTSFALGFDCEETNHLIVTIDDVEVLPADWYLSGSNVVFQTAPGNGKLIKLQRNTPFNRLADYQSYNNSFRPPAINKEFDRIWWKLQELGVADWLMKLYVDRLHQQQEEKIDDLKGYVDDRDDELRAYLLAEIQKQGVALDQLDEYYNYLMQRLAQIAIDKGWEASFVVDASGKTQQEINDQVNAKTYYIEDFGASPLNTPVQNSAAIRAAFLSLSDGDKLYQASSLIEIDRTDCTLTNAINNVTIKLNLKYAGAGASSIAAVFVNKLHDSSIDISIDGNNKNLRVLQCNECHGSVIPSNTILKNSYGTLSLVAGVFTRDSDDMQILCKVRNISTDGTQVVRGVMISDQTITKNTSYIAPQIENVTCPIGSAVVDADGVYAEHSNANHSGGIRIQNGIYKNCSKRFIKVTMPNPIITGNVGRNDNTDEKMYSFVSTYKDDAGLISDNDFQTSGSVGYGLEIGIASATLKATIGKNKLIASVVSNDSYAYRIQGPINNINISVGEVVGFSALFSQVNASTAVNQVLSLKTGSFNNLQSSDLRNCITISGDFKLFNVDDIECANPVASRFFISAPQISDGILNINNVKHAYSFGAIGGTSSRANNLTDGSSTRFESTKMVMRRASIPASGTYRAGDIIEYTSPSSWVGAVYDGAEWRSYGLINRFATVTYDPPSIPAEGSINTTVSLEGATVGSLVQAAFSVYNESIRIYPVVSSFNTVTVTFENTSSSAIDLGSGTLRVKLV